MRKLVFMLALMLAMCATVSAQTYTRQGTTFTETGTSKKSGKEYCKYLGEQISKEICAELGREYTYKPKEK